MSKNFENADLCAPATWDDPWELVEWLREESPVHWDPNNEVWYVSRHDLITEVARDPETFTSTEGNRPNLPPDPSLIHKDGDEHRIQRGLVSQGFSPKFIRKQEDNMRAIVVDLLSKVEDKGEMELIEDLAAPLPMRVIADMLGCPREKEKQVLSWIDAFLMGGNGPEYVDDTVNDAFEQFCEHHMEMVEERGEDPQGDDLLSRWMRAEIDGEKLEEDQLLFEHTLLNVGGAETTRSAIAGGIAELARNPEQYEFLSSNITDKAIVDNAIEELVRWVTPFHNMFRTATKDVQLGDKTIKEGQMVGMQYLPANRDPRKFKEPYKFDIQRDDVKNHISFGYGAHFCLGASLARMELRVVLEEFTKRFTNIQIKEGTTPKWRSSSFVRAPGEIWITFDRR